MLKCKILKGVKEHRSAENYKNARVGKSAKECWKGQKVNKSLKSTKELRKCRKQGLASSNLDKRKKYNKVQKGIKKC